MSEIAAANGQDGAAIPGPIFAINTQYVRDLSFENPRAPESLIVQAGPPEFNVEVDVKARQLSPELFEVVLKLQVEARTNNEVTFLIELDYGSVVTIRNAPPEVISALLLIETPRMMFPFVRNVIADATRDGGFPQLMIAPIDFADLQRRKFQQANPGADAEA